MNKLTLLACGFMLVCCTKQEPFDKQTKRYDPLFRMSQANYLIVKETLDKSTDKDTPVYEEGDMIGISFSSNSLWYSPSYSPKVVAYFQQEAQLEHALESREYRNCILVDLPKGRCCKILQSVRKYPEYDWELE